MKRISLILLMLIQINLFGQPQVKEQFNVLPEPAFSEDFNGAIALYKQMILFDPKNPVYHYKLGFAYLNTFGKQDSAIIYLKNSLQLLKKKDNPNLQVNEIKFYLARAYRLNGQIDSAIIILENLLKKITVPKNRKIIKREIKLAQYSLDKYFSVENLGEIINSPYTEHSPVFSEKYNILAFTSRRKTPNSTLLDDGQYDENIFISHLNNGKWSNPEYVNILNTPENEATIGFCDSGSKLLIYKGINKGDIYITEYKNGQWSEPLPLPYPINTRHRETHACFTPNMDTIFFSSNRPGGKGGLDIWMSYKKPDGKWSKPINLPINTKYNEESPEYISNKQTLFFSSDKPGGYGGYDIYKCQYKNNKWTTPKNLDFPVNSIDNDIFFYPIPKTHKAFYCSYKYDSKGFGDIFLINLNKICKKQKTLNIATILDSSGHIYNKAKIELINMDLAKKQFIKPSQGQIKFYTYSGFTYRFNVYIDGKLYFTDKFTMPDNSPEERFYKRIIVKKSNN